MLFEYKITVEVERESGKFSWTAGCCTPGTTRPSRRARRWHGTGWTTGLGQAMAAARGWTGVQWVCMDRLITRESGWRVTATNPSGAYGLPQALPGSKMGPGWRTDPTVQLRWFLQYVASRYGTPCGAWAHSQGTGWY